MRASKGYVAGVGTTGALMGAIGCAFAVLSAVVAVHGWPLALSAPSVATLEGRAPAGPAALPRLDVFGVAAEGRRLGGVAGDTARRGARNGGGVDRVADDAGPLAGAFAPPAGGRRHGANGSSGRVPSAGPGASAASPAPEGGAGSAPSPAQPGTGGPGSAPPPTGSGSDSGGGSSTGLGGTVTQVTSGAGTVVAQTGQQLSGTVQGTTGQLGGVVGQVSPAAGQTVTQTGQVVGGVVSGATGAAGQVVSGTGATVGGLLGGLGRARSG